MPADANGRPHHAASPRQSATAGIVAAGVLLKSPPRPPACGRSRKNTPSTWRRRAPPHPGKPPAPAHTSRTGRDRTRCAGAQPAAIARLPAAQAQGPARTARTGNRRSNGGDLPRPAAPVPQRLLVVGYRQRCADAVPARCRDRAAVDRPCQGRQRRLHGTQRRAARRTPAGRSHTCSSSTARQRRAVVGLSGDRRPGRFNRTASIRTVPGHFPWTVPVCHRWHAQRRGRRRAAVPLALAAAIGADAGTATSRSTAPITIIWSPAIPGSETSRCCRLDPPAARRPTRSTRNHAARPRRRGMVWYGRPDSDWATRPDVLGADRFHRLAQAVVIGLARGRSARARARCRRRRVLERLVAERTRQLHEPGGAGAGRSPRRPRHARGRHRPRIKNPLAWTRSNLDVCVDHARTLASLSRTGARRSGQGRHRCTRAETRAR